MAALLGCLLGIARLKSAVVVQSAFFTCAAAGVLATVMAIGVAFPATGDAVRMRGFAVVTAALFAINLLALWRPAFATAK